MRQGLFAKGFWNMPFGWMHIYGELPAYLLVVARVAGIAVAAPFFSGTVIPVRIKALLVAALAAAVFPLVTAQATVALPADLAAAAGGLAGELALGWLIGFSVAAIFMAVQLGIQMASQQAGMALGEIFNPMLDSSMPIASELYFYVSMLIFLGVHGHHALVRALLDSFETIPLMGFGLSEQAIGLTVNILAVSFGLAVRVGGPIALALLLAFMTLGFVSRTMPQLNILAVGFPIKILIALVMMAVTVMSLESVVLDSIARVLDGVRTLLGLPLL